MTAFQESPNVIGECENANFQVQFLQDVPLLIASEPLDTAQLGTTVTFPFNTLKVSLAL